MLASTKQWIVGNPWRFASILLGLGLVGAVVALLLDGGPDRVETPDGSATATTAPLQPGETTTVPDPGNPLAVDPNAPTQGLGSAYVSVKIDNAPGARPQVGLGDVPLLIEYPVEGGITRFVAVVNRDVTGALGPVRSLRPVDADLLPSLAPYVVSTGGQPFVLQDVAATGINMVDPQLFELFTTGDNPDPLNNLFLLLEVLFLTVGDSPALGDGFPAGVFPGGAAATEVTAPFESLTYRYEDEAYVRYDGATQYEVLDGIGGSAVPLAHDTVVVLFVAERFAGYTDGNDVPVTTFDVIGLGDLLVFHQGEAWREPGSAAPRRTTTASLTAQGRPSAYPRAASTSPSSRAVSRWGTSRVPNAWRHAYVTRCIENDADCYRAKEPNSIGPAGT